jgi:hypothetical protein
VPPPRISAGKQAILTELPPGLLEGLPVEDQDAIRRIVGKPVLLESYDDIGRAELTFIDSEDVIHSIFVKPEFIGPAD